MISQEVDLVAGDFNGTAWRHRGKDNLSTIDAAFIDSILPTPLGPPPWITIPRTSSRLFRCVVVVECMYVFAFKPTRFDQSFFWCRLCCSSPMSGWVCHWKPFWIPVGDSWKKALMEEWVFIGDGHTS